MKIFPKCLTGKLPQVTYNGYVMPCCWVPYTKTISYTDNTNKANPFLHDDFNLYNNDFNSIVGSEKWVNMLNDTFYKDVIPYKCSVACKSFILENGKVSSANSRQPKFFLEESNITSYWKKQSADREIFNNSTTHPADIVEVNLETTSRCTLQCPYCSRTIEKHTYQKGDLDFEVVKKLLYARDWKTVVDCPRYGDPIFYKHFSDMMDLLKDAPVKTYRIHVSATGRGTSWWDNTVKQFLQLKSCGTRVVITFGIDGLADTSKIHRIGQNWEEIIYALKKCAAAGIETIWQFIPFSHNEHQIQEAKELSKLFNAKFKIVISNRFSTVDKFRPLDPALSV